jgi:hypothetical protein
MTHNQTLQTGKSHMPLTDCGARGMLITRPGGTGAAEPFEPRQVREEAAVRRKFWAPPVILPGVFYRNSDYETCNGTLSTNL